MYRVLADAIAEPVSKGSPLLALLLAALVAGVLAVTLVLARRKKK